MKKIGYIFIVLCLSLSCEDVVEIDVTSEEPRLIFEAILRYNLVSPNENRISVSTTGSFFDEVEPSLLERIQLQDVTNGGVGFYAPDPDIFGDYIPGADGIPIYDLLYLTGEPNPENSLVLTFEYEEELYLAFANYVPAPEFISVTQGTETTLNDDETEIILSFMDPEDEDNFYVFGFGNGEYTVIEDTFFNGQEYTFSYFSSQNLEPNDDLLVTMWGVDEPFYNYMRQLIEQSERGENTLFQTPVSTVRGNILKVEDIDNVDLFNNVGRPQDFILGYFAVVQEHTATLTIQ